MASLFRGLRFASANSRTLAKNGKSLLTYSWLRNVRHSQLAQLTSEAQSDQTSQPQTEDKSASAEHDLKAEGIVLTDSCVKQLKRISEPGTYLRLLVEGGGCSGFQYKFELETEQGEDDVMFEQDGAKLIIDPESLEFMRGSVVDFSEELIRSSFSVKSNPMAEHGCSCGSSFNVKL